MKKTTNSMRADKCMLCGGKAFTPVHRLKDDDTRNAGRCERCSHIQVVPLPTSEEAYKFYQSGKMYERIFKDPTEIKNKENMAERLRLFAEYPLRKIVPYLHIDWKFLGIGSAYGYLLEALQRRGYDVDGVEIAEDYREMYRKRTGKQMLSFNFLTDEPDVLGRAEYYDCIFAIHTLEHINDTYTSITRAAKLLKPGGLIYVDVPNENDYMLRLSAEYAKHHYARAHVSYFSPDTLTCFLTKCGFKNVQIIGNQIYSPENMSQLLRYKEPICDYHQNELPSQ